MANGFNALFQEIGHTIEEVAGEVYQAGTESLRQAISRKVAETEYGRAVIGTIKQQQLSQMLPVIIIIAVVIFAGGMFLKR